VQNKKEKGERGGWGVPNQLLGRDGNVVSGKKRSEYRKSGGVSRKTRIPQRQTGEFWKVRRKEGLAKKTYLERERSKKKTQQ